MRRQLMFALLCAVLCLVLLVPTPALLFAKGPPPDRAACNYGCEALYYDGFLWCVVTSFFTFQIAHCNVDYNESVRKCVKACVGEPAEP